MSHRKHQNQKTKHHIIPQSRSGSDEDYNICMVPEHEHQLYHQLFSNKTPDEIINYLVDTFWNGDMRWLRF